MFILTWKFKAQLFHELPVIETGAEVCFIAVVGMQNRCHFIESTSLFRLS